MINNILRWFTFFIGFWCIINNRVISNCNYRMWWGYFLQYINIGKFFTRHRKHFDWIYLFHKSAQCKWCCGMGWRQKMWQFDASVWQFKALNILIPNSASIWRVCVHCTHIHTHTRIKHSIHEEKKSGHLDFIRASQKKCLLCKGFNHSEREKNNKDKTRSLIVLFGIVITEKGRLKRKKLCCRGEN